MKIAILGATSHIAQNLIVGMAAENNLTLFARSPNRVVEFINSEGIGRGVGEIRFLDSFGADNEHYDAIINCIGFGTPDKLRAQGVEVLFVTERYDNAILGYLSNNPSVIYVNFSSGAVYGTETLEPIDASSEFRIMLSSISVADAYRVSKLHSETKHRSMDGYSIIDLRLFSFFSRYIDMDSSYLITDLVNTIKNKAEFITSDTDLVRDYVHPKDLCDLVSLCVVAKGENRPFDVYSLRPVKKGEIIAAFQERFGLRIKIVNEKVKISPTGMKSIYASNNRDATRILGYVPKYSSIEALLDEAQVLLAKTVF